MRRPISPLCLVLALAACAPADPAPDSGAEPADAGTDAVRTDAGPPPPYELPDYTEPPAPGYAPLSTRCGMFVDATGRTVLLRGVNARVEGLFDVTFDDGREPLEPIPALTHADLARMRALGFDLLRLPIDWSGLEPTDVSPHLYDDAYVSRLRAVLEDARSLDMYVLVDFHQDAYSKEIGEDGAPLWAISPPPTMLLEGPLTDLGTRRTSAQVIAAFDTFYGDAEPGPTLRNRFGEAVAHLTDALRGQPNVVGIEIYNEPVASDAQTRRLNEAVAAAIASTDATRLAFFEPPSIPRNITGMAAIPTTPFAVPGAVYAPHAYTLAFVGTEAQRMAFTRETLRPMIANARREADAWGTPLLVGEWGYDPAGTRAAEYVDFTMDLLDEYAASWTFWVWKEASQGGWGLHDYDAATDTWTERPSLVRALSRPHPVYVAGWLHRYEVVGDTVEVRFRGETGVSSVNGIYVPESGTGYRVFCDDVEQTPEPRDAYGLVAIDCGGPGEHVVRLVGPGA